MAASTTAPPVRVWSSTTSPNIVDVIQMALRFQGFEVEPRRARAGPRAVAPSARS
jgi:hypothetical protein